MNTEEKTHWKKLVDPRYIGAYALPNGNDMTVTIDRVQLENVTMMGGKKEDHTIAHLKGQKPLILNVTNSKSIHKLYGPFIEDWAGKQVTLFASTTKMSGEIVECLRIRPSVPANEKKGLADSRFQDAIAKIRSGDFTVMALREKFQLTDQQEEEINEMERETT